MATSKTVVRRPKFDLRFITEDSEYQIRHNTKNLTNAYMTESIISVTTKNALEDDTSAFSFVLSGDMEWDKILRENDLVILNIEPNEYQPNKPFSKDHPWNRTVVVGLISEVRIEGAYGDDSKMYRITGQSFQKAFTNFELRTITQASMATGAAQGWMDFRPDAGEEESSFTKSIFQTTVASVAKTLIERFREFMKYNFEEAEGEKGGFDNFFEEKVTYLIGSWTADEALSDPLTITSFEGSLNQLVKEVAAPPFLEYFFEVNSGTEIGNEGVALIIRKTPFDKKEWEQLSKYVLRTRDVISENFGRTDIDAFSIYNVVPGMENEDLALMNAVPWYNESLVNKYGYKMLEVSSKFINFGTTEMQEDLREEVEADEDMEFYENTVAAKFGKKLYNWYVNNPNFYSGDITVVGHPDYRMGNILIYKNSNQNEMWEFYIESVQHSFSYEDGYTTELGVTRGLRISDENDHGIRFKPPAGKAKRFKGGYLGELNLAYIEEQRAAREAELNSGGTGEGGGDSDVVISAGGWTNPSPGGISSEFGGRTHPITGEWKVHTGLDISRVNGLDIRAARGGKVLSVKTGNTGYGNHVILSHETGLTTLYGHMSSMSVSAGESVMAGQKIGVQGTTGASTGVHLHFEVRLNGKPVDPRNYVDY